MWSLDSLLKAQLWALAVQTVIYQLIPGRRAKTKALSHLTKERFKFEH